MNKHGYVYIISDKFDGRLWVGVTSDLRLRIWQHRKYKVLGFSKKYKLKRLVYFEHCDSIHRAIWRENQMRAWRRSLKVTLIQKLNPQWDDLYFSL